VIARPMATDALDPLIHVPARLRLMVTLAALPHGDTLSFTRLQDMLGLTPGNLITHLRKLEDAGYVQTEKTGSGVNALTTVALTYDGRAALERYTTVLRQLLDTAEPAQQQ
jgi:DNA-binding MarR family transcriptional regulator